MIPPPGRRTRASLLPQMSGTRTVYCRTLAGYLMYEKFTCDSVRPAASVIARGPAASDSTRPACSSRTQARYGCPRPQHAAAAHVLRPVLQRGGLEGGAVAPACCQSRAITRATPITRLVPRAASRPCAPTALLKSFPWQLSPWRTCTSASLQA